MCDARIIFRIAGLFVMASVALGTWVHVGWFGFTAFVGFNMFQMSFSGFCPLERVLASLGWFGCRPRTAAP